ncbi:MAG: hypothetical protein OEY17_05670 [Nitrosopumilus sp.]|nr:hypothetical protein [Nitrosopumilus sp.]MDH5658811.1 hypothetical protein [Nitrosopumilus sp.]
MINKLDLENQSCLADSLRLLIVNEFIKESLLQAQNAKYPTLA